MTIGAALQTATKQLQGRSDSPRLDAEVVLAFILNRPRVFCLTYPEQSISAPQYRTFRRLIARRRQSWPIPYVTGQTEFFSLPLRVTPATLIPRPFTETLLDEALKYIPDTTQTTVVDVGTGSGALALAIATQRKKSTIVGTDISLPALRVARANERRILGTKKILWYRGSLLNALPRTIKPTIIIANLPYLTPPQLREPSIRHEPRSALVSGRDGLHHIRRLLLQCQRFPTITTVILEFDPSQSTTINRLLRQSWPGTVIIPVSDGRSVRGCIAQLPQRRAGTARRQK